MELSDTTNITRESSFQNQSRRIYEIIRLKFSTTPDLLRNYRLDVKRRLHQPFQVSEGINIPVFS